MHVISTTAASAKNGRTAIERGKEFYVIHVMWMTTTNGTSNTVYFIYVFLKFSAVKEVRSNVSELVSECHSFREELSKVNHSQGDITSHADGHVGCDRPTCVRVHVCRRMCGLRMFMSSGTFE